MNCASYYETLKLRFPKPVNYDQKTNTYYLTRCSHIRQALQKVESRSISDIRLNWETPDTRSYDATVYFNKFLENIDNLHETDWRITIPAASLDRERDILQVLMQGGLQSGRKIDIANEWIRPAVSRLLFDMVFANSELDAWSREAYAAAYGIVTFLDEKYGSQEEKEDCIRSFQKDLESVLKNCKADVSRVMAKFSIFATGHETPANVICNIIYHNAQKYRDNSAKMISEGVRIDPPLQCIIRYLREEIEVDGQLLPAGARLGLHLGLASRDETVFRNPGKFDISNGQEQLELFFGKPKAGCPGRHVVFQIARSFIPLLDSALDGWAVSGVEWLSNPDVRGILKLYLDSSSPTVTTFSGIAIGGISVPLGTV